jgi:hypothetical protein
MRTVELKTFKIIHRNCPLFLQGLVIIINNIYNFKYINTADIPRPRTGMRQQDYGIHCYVRSEICPHLTSLKIIIPIGVVEKNVFAVPVKITPCYFMHE